MNLNDPLNLGNIYDDRYELLQEHEGEVGAVVNWKIGSMYCTGKITKIRRKKDTGQVEYTIDDDRDHTIA